MSCSYRMAFFSGNVLTSTLRFYNEGFKEGQEASVKESLKEGKEYGLQTGFQRFLLVGQVKALVDHMESVYGVDCGTHMAQLRELVESINFDNDYNTVVAMDKLISKIRNKVRILSSSVIDRKITLQQLEEVADVITGLAEESNKQLNLTDLGNENVW